MITGISIIPTMAVIIAVVKHKKFINRFIDTGTVNPQSARSLEELDLRTGLIFRRLLNRKVLIEFGNGRYYLDEDNLAKYNKIRRIRFLVVIVALIILIIIDLLLLKL